MATQKTIPASAVDDAAQALSNGLSQLESLLLMTYGETGRTLRTYPESVYDNYLWACADKATALRDQAEALQVMLNKLLREVQS